ncbi:MAG: tRNA 2-thiouridine(34) synthase MnmA [Clostridiales bacterium]|nr:tRNA 2-thiouridine(34) synthase MnmA [Clostridiales bacterium]
MLDKKRVICGISGGVDSSAACLMLKNMGFDVVALYISMWNEDSERGVAQLEAARKCAEEAGVKFEHVDMTERFLSHVVAPFVQTYFEGRTPNPCVLCNPLLKFATLFNVADKLSAYYIATGHYAGAGYSEEYSSYMISSIKDEKKDQSYFLYGLADMDISRIIFPLSNMSKDEVRALVRENGLCNADAPDSEDICFMKDGDYRRFIEERSADEPLRGNFIRENGEIIAPHNGIHAYTLGQRKGLNVAAGERIFVTEKRSNGDIVLSSRDNLYKREIRLINVKKFVEAQENTQYFAKIRSVGKPSGCNVVCNQDGVCVVFDEPQFAPSPGQSVVVYDGKGYVILGGEIA